MVFLKCESLYSPYVYFMDQNIMTSYITIMLITFNFYEGVAHALDARIFLKDYVLKQVAACLLLICQFDQHNVV